MIWEIRIPDLVDVLMTAIAMFMIIVALLAWLSWAAILFPLALFVQLFFWQPYRDRATNFLGDLLFMVIR